MDFGNNSRYKGIIHKFYQMLVKNGGRPKRLPTLRTLAKEFHCTHPTVLRAVRELLNTGLLIQLKDGGYMTVPLDAEGQFRNIAVIFGGGIYLTDFDYSIRIKYHALHKFSTAVWKLEFSELHAETHKGLDRIIRTGAYAGLVLCSPDHQIIPEMNEVCRDIGIPVGIFAGCGQDHGDVSVIYDTKNDFLRVLEKLACRKCRRVLAVSSPRNPWNREIETAIREFSENFEKCCFLEDRLAAISEYIKENTGGAGENFDSVIYVRYIPGSYEELSKRVPDCFCVITEFDVPYIKDFRGLVMHFDLESAGAWFADSMLSALNKERPETSRYIISCSLEEIR